MKKLLPALSLTVILITLLGLIFFRQTPSGELWKGYSILYVPNEIPENAVLQEFNNSGISDWTGFSNQYLPLDLSADSLEVTLLPYNQYSLDYLTRRNNFFFDKTHSYKLYYVPSSYKNKLSGVQNNLNRSFSSDCGVDSKSSYPFLYPVLAFIFAILLLCFCKSKALYSGFMVFPFLYTLSFPFLSSVIGSFILLIIFFCVANLFGRRDFLKILGRKYVFYFLLLLAVVSSISSGFASSVLFLLVILSEFAVICIFRFIKVAIYKKSRFNPVMIRSSFAIPIFSGKEVIIFGSLLFFTVLSFIFSLFAFNVSTDLSSSEKNSRKSIALPSVSAVQKDSAFPQLEDYYQWDFIVRSFPERSLNEMSDFSFNPLSPVLKKGYKESGNGISEWTSEILYNQDYKDSVYSKIDLLPFNAFEKIMKKQGEDFQAGYATNGSYRLNLFCIIISFIQFSIILFYFAWILIHKKSRGRGRK